MPLILPKVGKAMRERLKDVAGANPNTGASFTLADG